MSKMDHRVEHQTKYGPVFTSSTSTPVDSDRYDWEVRIEGPPGHDVAKVEYLLPETFRDRARVTSDPSDGFLVRSDGLGEEFTVAVMVHFKDGAVVGLRHPLKLG